MAARRAFVAATLSRPAQYLQLRSYRSPTLPAPKDVGIHPDELEKLFAEPTWSVESLLPPKTRAPDTPKITSQQLHHLLRLSALPPPETPEEEQKMLDTLEDQLHFVGKIQEVDTTGVTPLRAIRLEGEAAKHDNTIELEDVDHLLRAEIYLKRRSKGFLPKFHAVAPKNVEDWDVLGSAKRTSGKYFVVESERPPE